MAWCAPTLDRPVIETGQHGEPLERELQGLETGAELALGHAATPLHLAFRM